MSFVLNTFRGTEPPLMLLCPQEGVPDEYDVIYVGSLSVDVDIMEQEVRIEQQQY